MDICQCNICPGDIWPYWQYLSCYWLNFDQILKVGSGDLLEHISTVKVTHLKKIPKYLPKHFAKQKFSPKKISQKNFAKKMGGGQFPGKFTYQVLASYEV